MAQAVFPALDGIVPGLGADAAHALAQTTVSCNGQPYLSRGGFALAHLDTARSNIPEGATIATASGRFYNALGYRVQDGFTYAMYNSTTTNGATNTLARISPTGTLQHLGTVSGLPVLSYQAGDVDELGNYYVMAVNQTNHLYRVNVTTRTATRITLTSTIGVEDLAWDPVTNRLYGWTYGPTAGRLAVIDPATGSVALRSPAGLDVANAEGMWFDADGNLFVAFRDTGDVYRFPAAQLALAAPAGTRVFDRGGTLALGGDNSVDIANCPYAPTVRKTFTPATFSAEDTTTLTLVVDNNLPTAMLVDVADVLPAGLLYVGGSLVSGGGGTPNAYGDTTTLTVTGVTVPGDGTATITVTVKASDPDQGGVKPNQAKLTVQTGQATLPVGVQGAVVYSNDPGQVLVNEPTNATVLDPQECTAAFWTLNGVAADSGDLFTRTTSGTPWPAPAQITNIAGGPYDAIAYNHLDGFFYALDANRIFRIDADGRVQDLGAISGLATTAVFAGATIGADGTLYARGAGNTTALYRIDIDARTFITATTGSFAAQDLAYNPYDGSVYAWSTTPAGRLVAVDPVTGATTVKNPDATDAATDTLADAEAVWFDSAGTFYALMQSTNDVWAVGNVGGATPTILDGNPAVAGKQPVTDNGSAFGTDGTVDGASCPFAPIIRKSWATASISAPGGTTTLQLRVFNPLPQPVSVNVSDVLPSNVVAYVGGTLTGAGTATVNGYGGTQTLTVTGLSVPAEGNVLLTVQVATTSLLGGRVDNQALLTVPTQAGVPTSIAGRTYVSDNPATAATYGDKTRLVVSGGFPCDSTAYMMQLRAGETYSSMWAVDATTATPTMELWLPQDPTTGTNVNPPSVFNGIGYNVLDGFIYGSLGSFPTGFDNGDLIRIDAAGQAVFIKVTNPAAQSSALGDVSADGLLYRPLTGTGGFTGVEIIDLKAINYSTNPPTVGSTIRNFTTPIPGGWADWAFNPTDGLLYAVDVDTTTDQVSVLRINPTTRTWSVVRTITDATVNPVGAAWFDAFGSLYAYHNTNTGDADHGTLYRWTNVHTATPTPLKLGSNFPATPGNDGSRCAYVPGFTKDVSPRVTSAGSVVTYTYRIRNGYPPGTPTNVTVDFHDVMTDGRTYVPGTVTVTGQTSGPSSTTLSPDNTDLRLAQIVIAPQQTAVVTVEVQTDPDTPDLPTTVLNQATLEGATPQPVVSDFPVTSAIFDDPTPLQLLAPFECRSEVYFLHGNPTTVSVYDPDTGDEAGVGGSGLGGLVNSLGFNPLDGLLYGIRQDTGETNVLVVVDSAGNVVDLGAVTGLPATQAYNGGTVDANGIMWVKTNLASSNLLYGIDLATRRATQYTTSTALGNWGDLAYNPLDGKLYLSNWTSDTQAQVAQITIADSATTKPTTITTFNPPDDVDSAAQGQWFDGNGFLMIRANSDGDVWRIAEVGTATPVMAQMGTATAGDVDAASCTPPELLKDVTPRAAVPGEVVTYSFKITNPTASALTTGLLDTQDSGRTFVAGTLAVVDETGTAVTGFTANAYGGTNTLDLDGLTPPPGDVFTATVQVRTDPASSPGTLLNQARLTGLPLAFEEVLSDFPDTTTRDDSTPLEILDVSIDVEKRHLFVTDAGQTGAADVGDVVQYSYDVTNTGAASLDIALTDVVEGSSTIAVSCPVSTLAPLSSTTCTATYTVTAGDLTTLGGGDNDLDNRVTASGTTVGGGTVQDSDVDVVPLAQLTSSLVVDKDYRITTDVDADGVADPGDVVTYTYRVTNTGTDTLDNVSAVDRHEGAGSPVPSALSCDATSLAANATATCTATYTVVQGDVDAQGPIDGVLDDVVVVTADDSTGATLTGVDAEAVPLPVDAPSLSLDKRWTITSDNGTPGVVDPGDQVAYIFVVTNNGNTTLENVTVTDVREIAPSLTITCPDPTLDPGESTTCMAPTVVVTEADVVAEQTDPDSRNSLTDVATASGLAGTNRLYDTDDEAVPVVALGPVFAAVKSSSIDDGDGFVSSGELITYTITVTNNGLVPATNVPVTDPVPDNTTFVTADSGGILNVLTSPPRVEWTIPTLAANGGTATLTFTVAAAAPLPAGVTAIGNQATIDGTTPSCADPDEDGDPATCDPTTDPVATPSIDVEKSHVLTTDADFDGFADAGDVITYSYRVENSGNVALASITVTDELEGASAPVSCPGTTLAVGASMTCTSTHTVTQAEVDGAGGGDGDLDNTATATGADGGTTVTDTDLDVVPLAPRAPGLVVDKTYAITTDAGTAGVAEAGDVVTYSYRITNTGNITLTAVGATDDHESAGPVPLTCTLATLAPNQSATCTSTTYTVTQADIDGQDDTSLDDTVRATGTDPTGTVLTATDSESVPVPQAQPAVTVDKRWAIAPDGGLAGSVDAGDTVTYSYVVTNNGNTTLNALVVTDVHELLGAVVASCSTTTLAPGASVTCATTWTVTEAQVSDEQGGDDSPNAVTDVVTARAVSPLGNAVTDTDEEAVPVVVLVPAIDVEKSHVIAADAGVLGAADVGETVSYSFTVTNTGGVPLTDVALTDALEGATPIAAGCPRNALGVGESMACTLSHTVTQAEVDGFGGGDGDLDNTVTATAQSVNGPATDTDVDVVPLPQTSVGLAVDKAATITTDAGTAGVAEVGDVVTYSYTVTNTGTGTLTSVGATDDHESAGSVPLTCTPTTLAPGQSATCGPTTHTVTQADVDGADDTSLDDTVVATALDAGGETLRAADSESVPLPVAGPALAVDKLVAISPDAGTTGMVDAGDTVTYSYLVVNNGETTLASLAATDVHETAGTLTTSCPVATLAPGASTVCTATWTADAAQVVAEQTDNDTPRAATDVVVASAAGPDGDVVSDTDEEAVPVAVLAPALDLEKTHGLTTDADADGFADVGDVVTYTFTVTNTGPIDLTGLDVSDVAEGAPAAGATCPDPDLGPGDTTVCTLSHTVTQAEMDGSGGGDGDLDNTATATAGSVNGPASDTDVDVVPLAPRAPGLVADKTWVLSTDAGTPGVADVGDVVTYGYTVANTGNTTLGSVGAADDHESAGSVPLTCAPTTLAPGQTAVCDPITYTVTQADIDGADDTSLDDTVVATALDAGGETLTATDAESVPVPQAAPALTVDKTRAIDPDAGTPGFVDPGDTVTYSYRVVNNGNVTVDALAVADTHEHLGVVTASCPAATLAPGASTVCTASWVAAEAQVVAEQTDTDDRRAAVDTVTASATAPDGDVVSDTDEEAVPVAVLAPALDLEKTHGLTTDADADGFADVGDVVTYTFTVTNTGPIDLTGLDVSDVAEGAPAAGATCPDTALTPTESVVCTLSHTVTQAEMDGAGGGDGDLDNTATATAGSVNGPASDTDVDVVPLAPRAPGLVADKTYAITTDADGDGLADVGDVVTYGYTVANTGNTTLTGLAATDAHESAGAVPLTCSSTTLAPNQSAACGATTYTVTQADIDGQDDTSLDDVVTATATDPGGETLTATDAESVPVPLAAPALTVDKAWVLGPDAATAGFVDPGDTVAYSYRVVNNGNVTVDALAVRDAHEHLGVVTASCPVATLAPGASTVCTASWVAAEAQVVAEQTDTDDRRAAVDTVTASAAAPDGDVVSDTDEEAVPVAVLAPALDLEKTHGLTTDADADGFVDVGDVVTYTFTVTNTGLVDLRELTVADVLERAAPVPATCPDTALTPTESVVCTLSHTVTQAEMDGAGGGDSDLDNTATATAGSVNGPASDTDVDVVALAQRMDRGIAVQKTYTISSDANGNGLADAGDVVTYAYVVRNVGRVQLTNLTLRDAHEGAGPGAPRELACSPTTLDPGTATTCMATYTVTPADDGQGDGTLDDTVTATATDPSGAVLIGRDSESVPLPVPRPSIAIVKEWQLTTDADADGVADAGDLVTYTYRVTNNGNATLDRVRVTDVHETAGEPAVSCSTTVLVAGDSAICTSTVAVTSEDVVAEQSDSDTGLSITDNAVAFGTTADGSVVSDSDDEAVPVQVLLPDLVPVKRVTDANGDGVASPGETLTYSIEIANRGLVDAEDVPVGDPTLAENIAQGLVTYSAGTTTVDGAAAADIHPGGMTVARVPASGAVVVAFRVVVADPLPAGTTEITNRAVVDEETTCDDDADTDCDTGIRVPSRLTSVKSVVDEGKDGFADPGELLTYTITIENFGAAADDVPVQDDLDPNTSLVAGSVTVDTAAQPGADVTAGFPVDVPAAASATDPGRAVVTFQARVVDPMPPGVRTVSNVANIGDTTSCDGDASDPDCDTELPTRPSVHAEKAVTDASGDGRASPGETLTYTITLTNNGSADAVDEPFSDPLDANTSFVAASVTVDGVARPDDNPRTGFPVTVATGDTVVVTFRVVVADPLDGDVTTISNQGRIGDRVTCSSDPPAPAPLSAASHDGTDCPPTVIPVGRPDLDLLKGHEWAVDRGRQGAGDAGDIVRYTYEVRNTGEVALTSVFVTDAHEGTGPLSAVSCPQATLEVGASMTCTATYRVTQEDIDGNGGGDGAIPNVATATATPPAGSPVTTTDDDAIAISPGTPLIAVDKQYAITDDTGAAGLAEEGDVVTYTYVVVNTGNVTLTDIGVVDDHEGSSSVVTPACGATTLAPGASTTCTAQYTVTAADQTLNDGRIDDVAVVAARGPDGAEVTSSDEESVPVVAAAPSITVDKAWTLDTDTGSPGLGDAGDVVAYTYRVTNNGNVPLDPVVLTDLHDGTGPFAAPECADAALEAQASTTCTATYTITQADVDAGNVVTNAATAVGTPPAGPNVDDIDGEAVPVPPSLPALAVVKTADITADSGTADTADPGDVIAYTYTVTNTGNVTLSTVTVTDDHSGTGPLGAITCDADTLAPDASTVCRSTYTVTDEDVARGGAITNLATATGRPPRGGAVGASDDEAVPVADLPRLTLAKSGTIVDVGANGTDGVADPGDVVRYEYLVVNAGNVALTDVTVGDVHEGDADVVTPRCPATTLGLGESMVCTATYTVTEPDVLARGGGDGTLDNVATATAIPAGGTAVTSPPAEEAVPLAEPRPAVTLAKRVTSAAADYRVGDRVAYGIHVRNVGNVVLRDVTIRDPKIPDLDCNGFDGVLSPAAQAECTGTLVVTEADAAHGRILNTASVDATPSVGSAVHADGGVEVAVAGLQLVQAPPASLPGPSASPAVSAIAATGQRVDVLAALGFASILSGGLLLLLASPARRRNAARIERT